MYGRDDSNIGFSVMHQSIEVKPDSDGEERVMSVDDGAGTGHEALSRRRA